MAVFMCMTSNTGMVVPSSAGMSIWLTVDCSTSDSWVRRCTAANSAW